MAEVALINPSSPYLDNDQAYPPTGLMFLAGKLESLGHSAEIHDLSGGHQLGDISSADLIGITCVTPNASEVKRLAGRLSQQAPVLIGGAHPTFLSGDITLPNVSLVRYEAESIIGRIMSDLEHGVLDGVYTGSNVDVSEITHPARHLVDLRRYSPGGWAGSTVVYASRGCPYSCNFCSKMSGSAYRAHSLKWVEAEVLECKAFGVDRIVFGDDNLLGDKGHIRDFLSMLGRLGVEYRLNRDARHIRHDYAELAASTGCVSISFGIESGSQGMLDQMNKQTTVAENANALRTAKAAGIETRAYLIVNFPGETRKTLEDTLEFVEETQPDTVLVSSFAPLPGSDVYVHPEKYGIHWISSDWDDYYLVGKGPPRATFETSELTAERQMDNWIWLTEGLKACGY